MTTFRFIPIIIISFQNITIRDTFIINQTKFVPIEEPILLDLYPKLVSLSYSRASNPNLTDLSVLLKFGLVTLNFPLTLLLPKESAVSTPRPLPK